MALLPSQGKWFSSWLDCGWSSPFNVCGGEKPGKVRNQDEQFFSSLSQPREVPCRKG